MSNEKPRRPLPYGEHVCPHCFNRINECLCGGLLPGHLILIDEGIQEHVRILNEKGYATDYCCESHGACDNLYISFVYAYGFGETLPSPGGFRCKQRGKLVERVYGKDSRARKRMTQEQFEAEKKASLDSLLEWAKALPDNTSSNALHGGFVRRDADDRCPLPAGASVEDILDSYVCLRCGEGLADCTCEFFPSQSIALLDREIRRQVDMLEDKGYECIAACAGHGPGSSVRVKLHKPFSKPWVDSPPAGFEFVNDRGWTIVERTIDADLSAEEAEADRQEALSSLLEWCEGLDEYALQAR